MSRFNRSTAGVVATPDTTNFAGGAAFSQTPEMELASLLLTSFVRDEYYESANDLLTRVRALLPQVSPEFAAKAAIFARDEFGMRSISHVVAAELARYVSGQPWGKSFYDQIVVRADDMTEILSYYWSQNGNGASVPNAMKKGFGRAFGRMDGYKLAKYRGEGKEVSLVDVVNLVRPVPSDKNRDALSKLVAGKLRNENTWEARSSAAGSDTDAKAAVWESLMDEGRMPYFALLRNLRNIEATGNDELIERACAQLVGDNPGEHRILPFQFLTAYENVSDGRVKRAVSEALDGACENVPSLSGRMLIAIDHSDSMTMRGNGFVFGSRKRIADAFGAIMLRSNNAADIMVFGTDAGLVGGTNPGDSTLTLAKQLDALPPPGGHGTSFHRIFEVAQKKYDRVVIFSDMQAWQESRQSTWYGYQHPGESLKAYERRVGHRPFVYSFDLAGHGTLAFPEKRVFSLAGISHKVFDLMEGLEQDPKALVSKINSVKL